MQNNIYYVAGISHFKIINYSTVSRRLSGSRSDEESYRRMLQRGNVTERFGANRARGEEGGLRDGDRLDHDTRPATVCALVQLDDAW